MDIDFLFVQRMRMGDERALETFVKNYYPLILRYCQIHIADYNYAEDMTIEVWQEYLLIVVGEYIDCFFISFLTMWVSAKTKSAVIAIIIPFVILFIPSFLGNIKRGN